MDVQTLGLVVTGLLIGAISGMLGIGGAVILVPTLVLVFGYSQSKAQGTSLGALVPPIGIFAALQYHRQGLLDVRAAVLIASGFVFGALGGAALVPHVPQVWLKRAFATVLVYVAAQLVFADSSRKLGAVLPGVVAAASLWLAYAATRIVLRRRPPSDAKKPPTDDDIDFHI
jgi:uncharacterized membrane protein YfcA